MRLQRFFFALRDAGVPVSTAEFLVLLEGLQLGLGACSIEELRDLARCILIKDEEHFDPFDRIFGVYFQDAGAPQLQEEVCLEEIVPVVHEGAYELPAAARDLLSRRRSQHRGQGAARAAGARAYRDYDSNAPLDSRGMRLALRRLRHFARDGAELEFDLDQTVRATAAAGGWLDIRTRPVRRNKARLLLLMDVGGSMDEHTRRVEELFSAVRSEFSAVEFYYFHNCVYDHVWRENQRRSQRTDTMDLIRRFGGKYQLLFVGDATMSPSEILLPGGGSEFRNAESGQRWLERLVDAFPRHAWLNPEPEATWDGLQTIQIVRRTLRRGMYGLTVGGVENAMKELAR